MIALSRRSVFVGGAALALPLPAWSAPQSHPLDDALDVRGVVLNGHAVLRTSGRVTCNTLSWTFNDNTAVSWSLGASGEVLEHRQGRLQLAPVGGGKAVEIFTGPVIEVLRPGEGALAHAPRGRTLSMTNAALTPDEAWAIIDNPATAALPTRVGELRVFIARPGDNGREVHWRMRSPWLAELGAAPANARLTWRGAGRLTAWRALENAAV